MARRFVAYGVGVAVVLGSLAAWGAEPVIVGPRVSAPTVGAMPRPFMDPARGTSAPIAKPHAPTMPGVGAPHPFVPAHAPSAHPISAPLPSHITVPAHPASAPPGFKTPAASAPHVDLTPTPLMTARQARRFMDTVARRESHAQAPGVMHDHETGLTFDGHPIDFKTGQLTGVPRNWSAASKESLDITLLVKAVQGDRVAQLALSPTGKPADAVPVALDRLTRKIDSYQDFNKRYPGFGGFLPWFRVDGVAGQKKMEPMPDWKDRVPALDNGQLAWSVYHAAGALRQAGHVELADRYQAQEKLMSKNVVKMFFDKGEKTLRAEARMLAPSDTPPKQNRYITNPDNKYFLNDSAEGLLMVHYADLFGKWKNVPKNAAGAPADPNRIANANRIGANLPSPEAPVTAHTEAIAFTQAPSARDALWTIPRHTQATYITKAGERITTDQGWRFSSHEDWGHTVLPFRDVPVANSLFMNAQRARTSFAADTGRPGLYASTHVPQTGNQKLQYDNRMGIPSISTKGTEALPIYAPYAAFPLALADKKIFATWLKNMTSAPRMFGPNGTGESFSGNGKKIAPVLTWDGKVLPLVAWSGGIANEVRANLVRDGKYDRFLETVRSGYGHFSAIEGTHLPLSPPSRGAPRGDGIREFAPTTTQPPVR